MAITYSLGAEPFWVIINEEGTVAGGAKMYTRRSQNHDQDKAVYQDASINIPWDNPIEFGLNGVEGPFYFQFDSDFPDETYYIYAEDAQGNFLWDINNYTGSSGGSGGGSNTTTYLPLRNYINNNQFIDNVGTTTTTALTNLVIAPSNHKGFTPAALNPIVGVKGVVGPDIRFLKNSTANTDNISFPDFNLASAPLFPTDVTPVRYVRYECTTSNAGESYKCFQFPITQKIKNLSNQSMTFKIWAAVAAAPVNLTAWVRQYFGSGTGASIEVNDQIGTLALTATWTAFYINFTVPTVAAKTVGNTDDDALYIQLQMPLNTGCTVYFTKPALYLGDLELAKEFDDYDEIDSINSTPRCGDVKIGYFPTAPLGWLRMDDTTSIGSAASAATYNHANAFQLYKTLWDGVDQDWAPVSGGVRGATAVADFVANKTLTMPRALGRALAGDGLGAGLTSRALGEYVGTSETYALTANNLPAHVHPAASGLFLVNTGINGFVAGAEPLSATGFTGSNSTTNTPINLMQPTSFMQVYIKL